MNAGHGNITDELREFEWNDSAGDWPLGVQPEYVPVASQELTSLRAVAEGMGIEDVDSMDMLDLIEAMSAPTAYVAGAAAAKAPTVKEIKAELKALGLSTKGKKAELEDRLIEATKPFADELSEAPVE